MANYQENQSYTVNKFHLDIHPYIAVPENIFDASAALQYGADFKTSFERSGGNGFIGLIQLIFPQTQLFQHTVIQTWNVDKRAPNADHFLMRRCLYSEDGIQIGEHSDVYQNDPTRFIANYRCNIIDTPREINNSFNRSTGEFTGITTTKFANYVIASTGEKGTIFDQGIVWGYSVVQDALDHTKFKLDVQSPKECTLTKTGEHQIALAKFLGVTRDIIKGCAG